VPSTSGGVRQCWKSIFTGLLSFGPARGVVLPAGGAIVQVDRSRVHTSETAALSGPPLATIAVAARTIQPRESLPGGVVATIGRW
jgi:hypothetical protein